MRLFSKQVVCKKKKKNIESLVSHLVLTTILDLGTSGIYSTMTPLALRSVDVAF